MCLYAKLIMSCLLIVFMFIIFRFNHGILNLDIVLIAKEHKFGLSEPCPNFLALDALSEERQRYDRWQKSNEMAQCYILASISNVL